MKTEDNSKYKNPLITKIGKKYYWGSLNLTNPIKEIIEEARKEAVEDEIKWLEKRLSLFWKIKDCECCKCHEASLKERLSFLKQKLKEGK